MRHAAGVWVGSTIFDFVGRERTCMYTVINNTNVSF